MAGVQDAGNNTFRVAAIPSTIRTGLSAESLASAARVRRCR